MVTRVQVDGSIVVWDLHESSSPLNELYIDADGNSFHLQQPSYNTGTSQSTEHRQSCSLHCLIVIVSHHVDVHWFAWVVLANRMHVIGQDHHMYLVRTYDTRCYFGVMACTQKLTWVSLIYHTEPTAKKWKAEKLKSTERIRWEVSVNGSGNPGSQSWRRKGRLRWEEFTEKEGFDLWRSVSAYCVSRRKHGVFSVGNLSVYCYCTAASHAFWYCMACHIKICWI